MWEHASRLYAARGAAALGQASLTVAEMLRRCGMLTNASQLIWLKMLTCQFDMQTRIELQCSLK